MGNLLSSILDFFVMIKDLIVNVLSGLFSVLTMIPQGIDFITTTIAYVPSVVTAFIVAGISICVIFFIIDR